MARLHEELGFDRLLVGHTSSSPDGFTVTDPMLTATSRLGVLRARRPGFVAPTVTARQNATLDAFHPGRVALHVIPSGDDADQLRDGSTPGKAARYRRSDEFLDIVKLTWSSTTPFDNEGEFYRVRGALSSVRPAGGACRSTSRAPRPRRSWSAVGGPTSTRSGGEPLAAIAPASPTCGRPRSRTAAGPGSALACAP